MATRFPNTVQTLGSIVFRLASCDSVILHFVGMLVGYHCCKPFYYYLKATRR